MPERSDEGAAALIIASGFERNVVNEARVSLRVAAAPVLLSYVRALELSNAELLRANRGLMSGNLGRGRLGGGIPAQRTASGREDARAREDHELHARRVEAWYDAPRYHLADRVRESRSRSPASHAQFASSGR